MSEVDSGKLALAVFTSDRPDFVESIDVVASHGANANTPDWRYGVGLSWRF